MGDQPMAGTLGAIKARFERLEKANRRLRLELGVAVAGLGAAILVIVGVGIALHAGMPDLIEARAFRVVAQDGTTLVKLDGAPGVELIWGTGPAGRIITYNARGRVLAGVGMTSAGAGTLATFGPNGVTVMIGASYEEGGGGFISVNDGAGKPAIVAASDGVSGGTALIVMLNVSGKEVVKIVANEVGEGGGGIVIRNSAGQGIVSLGGSGFGTGAVGVTDPSGALYPGMLLPGG